MKIGVITIFPEMFPGPLGFSVIGKALEAKSWQLDLIDLKKYGRQLDDTPYGGGDGMIMRPDILSQCIDDHIADYEHLVFTVPFGSLWKQKSVDELKGKKSILFICGRYEGIDYRIFEYYSSRYSTSFFSIGDYILCGGELATMVMAESVLRTLILRESVIQQESFSIVAESGETLLESPQYTKPETWRDMPVPLILKSGHHKKIQDWKKIQCKLITEKYRPDLLEIKNKDL